MVVYNLLELAVGLIDLRMVRPFGPAATAAVGVSRQVTFLVEAIALAMSTGVITLVSQAIGRRREPASMRSSAKAAGSSSSWVSPARWRAFSSAATFWSG